MRTLAVVLAMLAVVGARANGGSHHLGTGGLMLRSDAKISVVSERLEISPSSIRVDYLFRNRSKEDVRPLVGLPLHR